MMKHRKGIDLVRTGAVSGYTVGEGSQRGSGSTEGAYRVEVWTDEPESGGELLETISRATDFAVSCAAHRAAVRQRPGKVLVHLNGRHRMSCERAPDPPLPERQRPPVRRVGPHLDQKTKTTRLSKGLNNGTNSVPSAQLVSIRLGSIGGSLLGVSVEERSSRR